ncbi:MAG: hypothetical protein GWM92_18570 [Gemmatimonadetes bacterium]|nr:HEAT repeat domain-containing protein [Gemmatimonadota bacterium]NIR80803.1 HEAT repeat domain-containing protein [Gemmatimonadota bacterium]NIT89623.1 HEAT repeat domain-containing protein [Gemmatimonadota bacterium]NIU34229.1 HEAT repeat domain-containing protein [Gemmatimonadota bacterium]NIU37695.1 hypothetical protein [Gemmatimonadota bacterium]
MSEPPLDMSDRGVTGASLDWEEEVPAETLEAVKDLFVALGKALRAHQLYDENNPVYQRFVTGLRDAFGGVWSEMDRLPVQVQEDRFLWSGEVVYRSESRSDSLAFLFYKDGIREITFLPGIEDDELLTFLGVLQRARNLKPEGDDLLTILWEEDLETFRYHYIDVLAEGVELPEAGPGNEQSEFEAVLQGEVGDLEAGAVDDSGEAGTAREAPPGQVSTEDFNPTLYSLDAKEMETLRQGLKREMGRDLRRSVLEALFDRVEDPRRRERQSEILEIFRTLLPNFLSRGALRPAAALLHELDRLLSEEEMLDEERAEQARRILEDASAPETVGELVRALSDGSIRGDSEVLGTFLQFLRPKALIPLLRASERTEDENVREVLREAVQAIAGRHRSGLLGLLDAGDPLVVAGAVRVAGRMGMEDAGARLVRLLEHEAADVRLAAVEAALSLRAATVAEPLEWALEDEDRRVRMAAARALGSLGYAPATPLFREILGSKAMRRAGVGEMVAFFESYAELGDPDAVPFLDDILNGKGFLRRKEPEDLRASAALALGRIGTAEARAALEKAIDEPEPVVRSAVSRALRGEEEGRG